MWPYGVGEQPGPAGVPGPTGGEVEHDPSRVSDPGRYGDERAAHGRAGGFGKVVGGEGGGGAGEVERDQCAHEPGGVRGEHP